MFGFRFSKSRGLIASVSFVPLPHPLLSIFALAPTFARAKRRKPRSSLFAPWKCFLRRLWKKVFLTSTGVLIFSPRKNGRKWVRALWWYVPYIYYRFITLCNSVSFFKVVSNLLCLQYTTGSQERYCSYRLKLWRKLNAWSWFLHSVLDGCFWL